MGEESTRRARRTGTAVERERTGRTGTAAPGDPPAENGGGVRKKSGSLVRERPAVIFAAIADWAEAKQYPVEFMCTELGVSVSGYYAWRNRPAPARARSDEALSSLIVAIFERLKGNPGVRRVHAELVAAGHRLGRKRVWRLMRALGLQGRHPRAWKQTTVHGEQPVPAPDLIGRDFTAERANERWCGDITYIKSWDGWVYLALSLI